MLKWTKKAHNNKKKKKNQYKLFIETPQDGLFLTLFLRINDLVCFYDYRDDLRENRPIKLEAKKTFKTLTKITIRLTSIKSSFLKGLRGSKIHLLDLKNYFGLLQIQTNTNRYFEEKFLKIAQDYTSQLEQKFILIERKTIVTGFIRASGYRVLETIELSTTKNDRLSRNFNSIRENFNKKELSSKIILAGQDHCLESFLKISERPQNFEKIILKSSHWNPLEELYLRYKRQKRSCSFSRTCPSNLILETIYLNLNFYSNIEALRILIKTTRGLINKIYINRSFFIRVRDRSLKLFKKIIFEEFLIFHQKTFLK